MHMTHFFSSRLPVQNVLQLADGSGEWFYPKGAISENLVENLQYRLPATVTCARCVLQVRRCAGLRRLTCKSRVNLD